MDNHNNNNLNNYDSHKAYLENLNNYNSEFNNNNNNNLKPLENNKKLLLKYSGNTENQPKKLFEKDYKDYYPKDNYNNNKNFEIDNEIEEDIPKENLPSIGISKAYMRDPLHLKENSNNNNLKKFNFIKPLQNNNNLVGGNNFGVGGNNLVGNLAGNNLVNRERENLGIKKKNFMDSEKDILGMIKNNLERDVDMRPNVLIKNRDYSLNDNHLHRNYQINNLNSNFKEKNIGQINLNLNNVNNYNNNYNPVMTNINNKNDPINLKYQIPRRELKEKNYDYLLNKNNENHFNSSRKKWDFDANNNLNINKEKKEDFVYSSRRKLNPINRRSKLNDTELFNKENNNNISNNMNNNPLGNNNEEKGIKFESRRGHLLQKI